MDYVWHTDEDIRNDMHELSEFCTIPQPAPEPSEYMKTLRGRTSLFEDDFRADEPEEQENACIPVRGHPLLKDMLRKPGGRPSFYKQHQSDIREVSGFGYANDLIEHSIRGNSSDEKDSEKKNNFQFISPSRKKKDVKTDEESDSTTNSSLEYNGFKNTETNLDIYNKKEFPELP